MAKIGRNETCPCGSGLKYKRCCLKQKRGNAPVSSVQQLKISLMAEIEKIQRAAQQREEVVRELGVFVLWSNTEGDAWLLEISESDAVQVARQGEALEASIEENSDTIEINWSNTFDIRDRELFMTTYAEKEEQRVEPAPTKRISAAIRRVRKKYSDELLSQVHIDPQESEQAAS